MTSYEIRISEWSSEVCSFVLLWLCFRQFDFSLWRLHVARCLFRAALGSGPGRDWCSSARLRDSWFLVWPADRPGRRPLGARQVVAHRARVGRSEEHTSELQSLMRISYAVFCLKKKKQNNNDNAEDAKSSTRYNNNISKQTIHKRTSHV